MRKVTQQTVNAFFNRQRFAMGNSTVSHDSGVGTRYYLHSNLIAVLDEAGRLFVSSAGWETRTTADRLHAIVYRYNGGRVGIKNWKFMLNDEPWLNSATLTEIKK